MEHCFVVQMEHCLLMAVHLVHCVLMQMEHRSMMAVHLVHCWVMQMGALLGDADGPPVGSPLGPLLG